MKAFKMRRGVVAVVATTSFSVVASGAGLEEYGYGGVACVRRSSSPAPEASFAVSQGRVYNADSSATLRLDCPVLRPVFGANTGPFNVGLIALDQHFSQDVFCQARAHDPATDSFYFDSRTTSGSNPTPQKLNLTPSGVDAADTYYYLYCEMPPTFNGIKSGIMSIDFQEFFP